ncbi:MAG: LysM peptidoglycan-binding domain-containing protein [Verrucomicrobiales bacterium]|nr:LysM peptidoglycan-binding domain-containing protein [Verrucomicrobiales bacterium]
MKKIALLFCFFYAACCIQDTLGQQQTTTPVKPVEPIVEKPEKPKAAPPVKPAAGKPTPEPAPQTYVIKSGDNPWLIAKNHGIKLDALLKANDIKDPKNLKIGDRLTLPQGVASKNTPKPVAEKKSEEKKPAGPQEGDGWVMYTIKKGDNPWKISKALKVDHQKIMSLNEGVDFRKLAIGQQIKVPIK